MKTILNYFLPCAVFFEICYGQCPEYNPEPPQLQGVFLEARVSFSPTQGIFTYTYSIINGVTSTGCIRQFDLDISYPEGGIELSQGFLIDYPKHVNRGALVISGARRVVPVGIPSLPQFRGFRSAWWAGFSIHGRVGWMGADRILYLEPGARLDSIIMTSNGLPSLRSFAISPSYNPMPPVIITPENEDSVRRNVPEPTEEESRAFLRLEDSIKVRGTTIGPTAPPANFVALSFLDTLISYKHQARGLGWLKDKRAKKDDNDDDDDENQTIVQQLDHRLDKAIKELVKGDSAKARQELEKFVRRVEGLRQQSLRAEQRKRQEQVVLTSEAHALLKFNAEYLIDRLPKKKGRK